MYICATGFVKDIPRASQFPFGLRQNALANRGGMARKADAGPAADPRGGLVPDHAPDFDLAVEQASDHDVIASRRQACHRLAHQSIVSRTTFQFRDGGELRTQHIATVMSACEILLMHQRLHQATAVPITIPG